ncbi:MAG: ribosome maturation factor RimM, partial [Eubacteriales bacterium]
MAKQNYLECGKAVSTHGVRGTLRLESYCDEPEVLAKLRRLYVKNSSGEYECRKVRAASVQKNMVLCTLEAVTTLEEAIRYKGTVFYADRADLKLSDGAVFIADLLGLEVIDHASGETYGTLAEVISPGGRDVYVVNDRNGGSFMIPAVPEFIKSI